MFCKLSQAPQAILSRSSRMLENAVRICDATFGNIYRWDGEICIFCSLQYAASIAEARQAFTRPSQPEIFCGSR